MVKGIFVTKEKSLKVSSNRYFMVWEWVLWNIFVVEPKLQGPEWTIQELVKSVFV